MRSNFVSTSKPAKQRAKKIPWESVDVGTAFTFLHRKKKAGFKTVQQVLLVAAFSCCTGLLFKSWVSHSFKRLLEHLNKIVNKSRGNAPAHADASLCRSPLTLDRLVGPGSLMHRPFAPLHPPLLPLRYRCRQPARDCAYPLPTL